MKHDEVILEFAAREINKWTEMKLAIGENVFE